MLVTARLCYDALSTWCAWNLVGCDAARTHFHLDDFSLGERAHNLKIRLPCSARLVVRVGDIIAECDTLVAVIAAISFDGHDLYS